jgi:hypothetical protein
MRAGFNADPTAGAQFGFEIENHGLAMLHLIDLLIGCRIYSEKLQGINGACNDAIVTAGTTVHVHVYCECHFSSRTSFQSIKNRLKNYG